MDMFNMTHKLTDVDIPGIDSDGVYNAWNFMDRGDTLNGRDWKAYFTEAMISPGG